MLAVSTPLPSNEGRYIFLMLLSTIKQSWVSTPLPSNEGRYLIRLIQLIPILVAVSTPLPSNEGRYLPLFNLLSCLMSRGSLRG